MKAHYDWGHEFSEADTYRYTHNGTEHRACRTCKRRLDRERKAKRRRGAAQPPKPRGRPSWPCEWAADDERWWLNIPASDSRERAVADSQFGGGATTWAPATWYVGASTTFSNPDGSNFTEPVGNAYVRIAKTNDVTNFPAATTVSGVTTKKNGTKITWPNPTGTWGLLVEIGFFLAASGGTPEWTFKPPTPITVQSGNTPVEIDVNQGVMRFGPSGS